MLVLIPPKISISTFMGTVKGRTAIRVLKKFRKLKKMPFWGQKHFHPLLGVIGKPGPLGSVFYFISRRLRPIIITGKSAFKGKIILNRQYSASATFA